MGEPFVCISCSGLHVSADWHACTQMLKEVQSAIAATDSYGLPTALTSLTESKRKKPEMASDENLQAHRAERPESKSNAQMHIY